MKLIEPNVSIIIPALRADDHFVRCLYSIHSALRGVLPYEVLSVVRDSDSFADIPLDNLRILPEAEPGIYNAMNLGLKSATGTYLYFIGQDDILLPGAAHALERGLAANADLVLADVFGGRVELLEIARLDTL